MSEDKVIEGDVMDGVVKSTIVITTKQGEQYTIQAFKNRKDQTIQIVEWLFEKKAFVFPVMDETRQWEDVIIPCDVVYQARVRDFSQLTVAKSKIVDPRRPGVQ